MAFWKYHYELCLCVSPDLRNQSLVTFKLTFNKSDLSTSTFIRSMYTITGIIMIVKSKAGVRTWCGLSPGRRYNQDTRLQYDMLEVFSLNRLSTKTTNQ